MSSDGRNGTFPDAVTDVFWLVLVTMYCYTRHPILMYFTWCQRKALPCPADPHHTTDMFLWRKIFDHDPTTIALSDKLVSKQIALELCPDIKIPKTLWIGERFEDIPPELLAGDAVVKTTHGSGFFHIIRDGDYDRQELIARTRKWMRTDYSRYCGEWNYRGIDRKLFVEELLKHGDGRPVAMEAKVYVFGGTAPYTFCFHDRLTDKARQSFYDTHGNAHDYTQYLHYPVSFDPAPACLSHLFEVAKRLAGERFKYTNNVY